MADQKDGIQKWTEAEKTHFLMEAIAQMQAAGATLNFQKFTLPGRTPKALRHFWAKIRKENAAYVTQLGVQGGASATADETKTPKSGASTPANRKRFAQAAGLGNSDDEDNNSAVTPTPTPSKRSRNTPSKPRGKAKSTPVAKANDADEEEDEAKQEEVKVGVHQFDSGFLSSSGRV
ncbi:hypothetical protein F5Y09DRAFT_336742 [Xylaria sp. FL1042]|nr:hypothetical protein F5Y09DRAFT_336701 [Xylaria sp. FL1042]KAI0435367.1 hypothetical protein F5Y09DRAFT_336742 [Xylaria sp. FL1042]